MIRIMVHSVGRGEEIQSLLASLKRNLAGGVFGLFIEANPGQSL